MALPFIKSLAQCADYESTVAPFVPQLWDLPQRILSSLNGPNSLLDVYVQTNPLISGLAFSLVLWPVFLVVAEINRNYSQVDRVWSVLPVLYHLHYLTYAYLSGQSTERSALAFSAVLVWGVSSSHPRIAPRFTSH